MCLFGILDHNILPDLIVLCSNCEATNLLKELFCFKANASKILQSDLLGLGFFTDIYGPGGIGILSVNPSGVIPFLLQKWPYTVVDNHI